MLPVPLLTQLIRLGDDALGEFFSRYVTAALELYLGARRGLRSVADAAPMARIPVGATDALARMWMNTPMGQMLGFGGQGFVPGYATEPEPPPPVQAPPPPSSPPAAAAQQPPPAPAAGAEPATSGDVAALRRELDELKQALRADALGKPGARRKKKA